MGWGGRQLALAAFFWSPVMAFLISACSARWSAILVKLHLLKYLMCSVSAWPLSTLLQLFMKFFWKIS